MNKKYDGMRSPSIDDLIKVSKSKYRLVVGAAKRAKDLSRKNNPCEPLIEKPDSKKPIGIALEEVIAGKIEIVNLEEEEK